MAAQKGFFEAIERAALAKKTTRSELADIMFDMFELSLPRTAPLDTCLFILCDSAKNDAELSTILSKILEAK